MSATRACVHLGKVISRKPGGWGRKTVKQESQYKCLSSSGYSKTGDRGDGLLLCSHMECVSELSTQGTEEVGIYPLDSVATVVKGCYFSGCMWDQV